MNIKAVIISLGLAAALSFSGCKKVKDYLHQRLAGKPVGTEPARAPAPIPTPSPSPTPAPTPPPPPAPAINRSAAVMSLCYHRFEEHPRPNDALAITPAEFEKQLRQIKENGYTVIPMQDFLAWRRGEKDIPAKSAILTIDDGYISSYDTAWPILKKFNYPFTMFVYIDYIGSGGKSMTWDQLAEMRDAGVDIQSHSYSHSNLRSPGNGVDKKTRERVAADIKTLGMDGWLRKEIAGSKETLEKQLGIKVNVFAYPFGIYSAKAREMVKEAGYEAAFTVYGQRLGISSPFDLMGRYAVEQNKPQIFESALTMTGGGVAGSYAAAAGPAVAQIAAASMITQPMEGETVSDPKPLIKANIATMGPIDAGSLEMRISGFGVVPAEYDEAAKTVSYQVTQKLRDKNYTVILAAKSQGKRVETRWTFNFDPNAKPAQPESLPPAQ